MALRRNHLKKMTLDQVMDRNQAETDSDNIRMITSYLNDKNQLLIDKKTSLLDHLQSVRNKI